jgi:hypothetical protein
MPFSSFTFCSMFMLVMLLMMKWTRSITLSSGTGNDTFCALASSVSALMVEKRALGLEGVAGMAVGKPAALPSRDLAGVPAAASAALVAAADSAAALAAAPFAAMVAMAASMER